MLITFPSRLLEKRVGHKWTLLNKRFS